MQPPEEFVQVFDGTRKKRCQISGCKTCALFIGPREVNSGEVDGNGSDGGELKQGLVRTEIILSGRMISIEDNITVWEREELYKDENCYLLEDLKTQPGLLVDILTRAIQNLAENTVNEIL